MVRRPNGWRHNLLPALPLALVILCATVLAQQTNTLGQGWPTYGADPGGSRYSNSTQIDRSNLSHLHPVWTFHTHALDHPRTGRDDASFEATPILSGDTLFFTSPFDVIFAIDAHNGNLRWRYDPKIGYLTPGGMVTSRGVSLWESPTPRTGAPCNRRILLGTLDARLLALDADTGQPCRDFGTSGQIDLRKDVDFQDFGFYEVTSPPTILGNIAVVGSSVGDNQQVDSESGLVRAFDVVTGRQLWSWEPLPWAHNNHPRTGAGNTWSVISADPALGLVYLPTGSASPDYYGGLRPGDNRDADSIVALDVHTGRKVWSFQFVHHDLWDYDVAAQPLLFTFRDTTPAIAVTTKMGTVFAFDRRNGQPLYPVQERAVPSSNVPGEAAFRTQPFSALPSLAPLVFTPTTGQDAQRGLWNQLVCKVKLSGLRYDGLYTPPSTSGSILYPGNLGGVNWGSAALDPSTGILYANNNRAAYSSRLIPQHGLYAIWLDNFEPTIRDWPLWIYSALAILILNLAYRLLQSRKRPTSNPARPWIPSRRAILTAMLVAAIAAPMCIFPRPVDLSHFGHELSPQRKAPYRILRDPLTDSSGQPCIAPPWGAISALNLNTGKIAWQTPLGTMIPGQHTGIMNFGGPIVTASGLVFTAAAEDPYIRAFDAATGQQLWQHDLPVPAQSTPMTYTLDGRQYLLIAAGGHADHKSLRGDSLIAFALDDPHSH